MENKKCLNCVEYKRCKDSYIAWVFFVIGLIATIAIRVVTILMHMNPLYGKISWYMGVSGFFAFFVYRFRISQARIKAINDRNLMDKIKQEKQLTKEDYNLINAILCGLRSKKESINYFFIFGLSALAILLAIYIDFFK